MPVTLWLVISYLITFLQFEFTFLLHSCAEVPEYDLCCRILNKTQRSSAIVMAEESISFPYCSVHKLLKLFVRHLT